MKRIRHCRQSRPGGQEVPDTQSLTRPGSVGILYELFVLEGDTVIRILAPANDFSDL